ncbi:DUF2935 domain-containing protein [Sporomusa sphaeroides]|uniref:DUF2935 domain-containing protein n=1 Tax=Sporomusa sphaeroides TaxID=47679 RepID=UPI003DA18E8C
MSRQDYIRISIEINLFFQRIMKEHLFFIETNLQPVETEYIEEARMLKQGFEQLLTETVHYADGIISENYIRSLEMVTPFTLKAEKVNSMLTGAKIDTRITQAEYELEGQPNFHHNQRLEQIVDNLNNRSYCLLEDVIAFQTKLLELTLECKIFITLYQEMLEHDTREAQYYLELLRCLQNRKLPKKTLCDELNFWNNIMGEHAQFIDGMLDPTEKTLKATAETFAETFEQLVEECIGAAERQLVQRSLESTREIRNFKRASTEGLLNCNIRAIIPPLLADHVFREANHYLRLLSMMKVINREEPQSETN